MGYSPTESLELASLVFFGITILPVCYCFYMHGLHGIGSWLNALIWNTLRLAGNGVAFKALVTTGIPNIIIPLAVNGCGLSPIPLICLGFLNESNVSIRKDLPWWAAIWGSLIAHILLIVGIAVGLSGLTQPIRLKAGFIVWIAGWLYTGLMMAGSWFSPATQNRLPGERILLYAATFAWPLVGIRMLYVTYDGYVYHIFDQGSITVQAICGVLPEFLCMIAYLVAGIWTRDLSHTHKILRQEANEAKKQAKASYEIRNTSASSSAVPLDKYTSCAASEDLHHPLSRSLTNCVPVEV